MDRRTFVKAGVLGAAAVSSPFTVLGDAVRTFKVAVVGCGGRGTGAVRDIHRAAKRLGCKIEVTACADFFAEKAQTLAKAYGVDEKFAFAGPDSYRKAIATPCEIVLLATPPIFRPLHAAACVAAGKHIFAEKPIATDPRGVREFLKVVADAKAKGLSILSGTLHRHTSRFLRQIGPVRDGAIGKIMAARVYRCHGAIWNRPRRPTDTNAGFLCNNWYHFWEMSGDQITEQAIHEVDLANWFIGRFPKSAIGMGGRWRRPAGVGDIYDSIAIDYDYGDELHCATYGRHVNGCANPMGTRLVGTEGMLSVGAKLVRWDGRVVPPDEARVAGRDESGLTMEHADFLEGLMKGELLHEGEQVAMSTATCIIGTLAAYSGRQVRMEDILTNEKSEFFNGWNSAFRPIDFEGPNDIALPPMGQAIAPGKA